MTVINIFKAKITFDSLDVTFQTKSPVSGHIKKTCIKELIQLTLFKLGTDKCVVTVICFRGL